MDDQIGSILARVASTLKASDAEVERLESLNRNIRRILPQLPERYWHKLDANARNQVVVHPDTEPFEATFSGGAGNLKANYHVLRPVIVQRNGTRHPPIVDGGLFVHRDGTFFAFNKACESTTTMLAKLTISHSHSILLTGKDLHFFVPLLLSVNAVGRGSFGRIKRYLISLTLCRLALRFLTGGT